MSGTKLFISLALAALCIAMTTAKPTRRSRPKHINLLEYACGGTNVTSNEPLPAKTCSCGNETRQCNWTSLSVVGRFDESLSLIFCDMSHDVEAALPGVLKHSCSVVDATNGESIHSRTCPAPSGETPPDCDTAVAPLSAKINDTLVNAFFCPPPSSQSGAHSHSADDDDEDVDTCIRRRDDDSSSSSDSDDDTDDSSSSDSQSRPRRRQGKQTRSSRRPRQ